MYSPQNRKNDSVERNDQTGMSREQERVRRAADGKVRGRSRRKKNHLPWKNMAESQTAESMAEPTEEPEPEEEAAEEPEVTAEAEPGEESAEEPETTAEAESGEESTEEPESAAEPESVMEPEPKEEPAEEPEPVGEPEKEPEKADVRSDKKIAKTVALILGAVLVLGVGAYGLFGQRYRKVYFPNTAINGLNVEGKTPEEVKALIRAGIDGYVLTLEERGREEDSAGIEEQIFGTDIDLHPEFDGSLEELLASQEPLSWGIHLFKWNEYTIGTMVAYDEEKLDQVIGALNAVDPDQIQKPVDAYCSDYIDGVGYEVVPEVKGNEPDVERLTEVISDAVSNLQKSLELEYLGVYQKPAITTEDETLCARVEQWNRVVNTVVVHRFGSAAEILDGTTTHSWLSADDQGNPQIDTTQVEAYVQSLAKKYNTAYTNRTLKTTYGTEVTVSGPYGWRINQSVEAAALAEIIASGESQEREPVYSQTAASHDGNDYGNTYVEANLTAQHLYYYVDGALVVESDFVSGNESKGMGTPTGLYPLTYKQRNATLNGEGYSTPVSYWMPFNGGVGLHDASWRSSFGGSIYKTSGSHGCINLPSSVAKKIYENISAGTPVFCYKLGGTERSGSSSTAATTAAETTAAVTEAVTLAETTAAETIGTVEETTAVEPAASGPGVTEAAAETPAETTSAVEEAPTAVSGGPGAATETTASATGDTSGPSSYGEEPVAVRAPGE